MQSTHDKILRNIGRLHTFNDFKEVLKNANAVGFKNISVDLIYPLPGLNLSGSNPSLLPNSRFWIFLYWIRM